MIKRYLNSFLTYVLSTFIYSATFVITTIYAIFTGGFTFWTTGLPFAGMIVSMYMGAEILDRDRLRKGVIGLPFIIPVLPLIILTVEIGKKLDINV